MSVSGGGHSGAGNFYDAIDNVELGDDLRGDDNVLSSYNDSLITHADDASTDQLREQYTEELKQIEEEIQTLRQVLLAKFRRQQFLKRQLGITVISELRDDINRGVDTIRTSEAFQKTTAAVKTAKEKTSAALYDKWNYLKQTNAFKSFEDKLESAYSSVRNRLVRSGTISTSHPIVSGEVVDQIAKPRSSPPPQAVYSLDGNGDSHVDTSSTRNPISIEELDAEFLPSDHRPVTESAVAPTVGAGDQRRQSKQNRSPRKK